MTGQAYGDIHGILLDHGQNPNVVCQSYGISPIHIAAARGHVSILQLLLSAGADPNHRDTVAGLSALHYAANSQQSSSSSIIELLSSLAASLFFSLLMSRG